MESIKLTLIGLAAAGILGFIAWLRHTVQQLNAVKSELTKEKVNATTAVQEQKVSEATTKAAASLERYAALKRIRDRGAKSD
jgi:cytoskeletal protein RodZ